MQYGKVYSRSGRGTMMQSRAEYQTISATARYSTASKPTGDVLPLGNAVVPIAAYFDGRPQDSHKNSTVILVDVLKNFVSNISGCEVDGVGQSKFLAITRCCELVARTGTSSFPHRAYTVLF